MNFIVCKLDLNKAVFSDTKSKILISLVIACAYPGICMFPQRTLCLRTLLYYLNVAIWILLSIHSEKFGKLLYFSKYWFIKYYNIVYKNSKNSIFESSWNIYSSHPTQPPKTQNLISYMSDQHSNMIFCKSRGN